MAATVPDLPEEDDPQIVVMSRSHQSSMISFDQRLKLNGRQSQATFRDGRIYIA